MTDKERLKKLMLALGFASKTKFAKSIGKNRDDIIRNVIDGKNGITDNTAFLITRVYKRVRFEWLRYGTGEMFLSEDEIEKIRPGHNGCPACAVYERYVKELEARVREQEKVINMLNR